MLKQKISSPYVLDWPFDTSVHNNLLVIDISTETTIVQSKNTHMFVSCNYNWSNMTSKRTDKTPKMRMNDILWQHYFKRQ
jgi:hypothetical protein